MIDEKKLFKDLFIVNGKRIPFVDCDNMPLTITYKDLYKILKNQTKVGEWIPVEKGLPNDLQEVSVTFVNHKPHPHYEKIKDIPMSAFAVYFRGIWYWWNSTICDYISEYGGCASQMFDENIEVIAWKPRSEPYRKEDNK